MRVPPDFIYMLPPGGTFLVILAVVGAVATLPLVLRVGTLTGLVVLIMTWVVAPQLTRVMKPWLHKH